MLKNKVAFVTGGDKGIGKGIVDKFAENGADVIFTYNTNLEAAQTTQEEAKKYGHQVEFVQLDVTERDGIINVCKNKNIDILVNNAGIVNDALFAVANYEKWWRVVDVIFHGTVDVTREVLFHMINRKYGRIINITSVGGVIGIPGQTNYTSAKGAILSFTKSLSKEVARLGITVNAISPGYVDTEMVQNYPEDIKQRFKEAVPMKRFATPEEIANVALFLASDLSSYITGKNIIVDGGMIS